MVGRLKDKVAIVTGGAGGIGAATGQLFCEEGAWVVLVDRDAAAMTAVEAEIRAAVPGAELLPLILDVSEEATAAVIVASTKAAFGRLDVLVNNAGIRSYEPLAEVTSETWRKILAVNLLSHSYLTREALPELRATGRASIINISSTHALNSRAGMGQYDVTKAGILSMTRTLAFEEASHGVRVNAVCPGLTLTPFHVRRLDKTRQELEAEEVENCLLRRWATAREVAYPILWLASDEASYMTAATIMVDGGTRIP
ncbi:SDR family NAD(P)-dependent oxidoreductase [Teichococcus vastitatis]|uniref:SDR family oxidoreductase n=1 Tax=Teichococcus vastitatis TaxID=2307076 RepID=A0ABS9W9X3_9PROT|nr:SDR family oxidoreductase [Pseudoroseomonas vastitatis]MCI0756111.1 SDR family oxidoreductase [Pseudoroseomonas vastitatis]